MVHAIHLAPSSDFKINLETDRLILHGNVDESSGVILRGSVIMDCAEATKVKTVTLKFIGKMKVAWTEGVGSHQRFHKDERTIYEHEWSFLPPRKKVYQLAAGQYKWDFELPLPGDLPETIEGSEHGQVYYKLKALAERPTFSMNFVDKRPIQVLRYMLPSALELSQSLLISNEWAGKMSYEISVPCKVYSGGDVIPITFDLTPIAAELKARYVTCTLKEYCTYNAGEHHKSDSRIVKFLRDDEFPCSGDRWTKVELLRVPHIGTNIQTDAETEMIKIKHKLKFTVSLINLDGHISELRAAVPIVISSVSHTEEVNALPAYEDAWKSMPYDPEVLRQLIASGGMPRSLAVAMPNAAASSAQNPNSDDDDEGSNDDRLPWDISGIDLSRVPSYTTAVRSNRLYSFSGSLPTYESISVPGVAR
ncbi:hypothetical protein BGW37DRAFT_476638 [Umbelopsis sp. PMI_123]|nr:hypothetical protein BGW37DRAFT_476638 [Umbelopsis sp. PMI_123]